MFTYGSRAGVRFTSPNRRSINPRYADALYARRVDGIENREWLEAQIEKNLSITDIADVAGVSRQTVYAWIERHKLRPIRSQRVRPPPVELALLYDRCRTTRELGEQLGVAPETARRWLVDADIDRRRARLDTGEVRAKRRAGATIGQLATEYGVGNDTIRRRLDPSWGD